jgi:hypothetical protein
MSGHVESLEYGWWEKKRQPLPVTIGAKNNFVIQPEELQAYQQELLKLKAVVDEELGGGEVHRRSTEDGSLAPLGTVRSYVLHDSARAGVQGAHETQRAELHAMAVGCN